VGCKILKFAVRFITKSDLMKILVVVVVVVLSWVKAEAAEPLYPHHNYILG